MQPLLAVTVVLSVIACASARLAPTTHQAADISLSTRNLLQGPNCARISDCDQCYNAKNDDSMTVLVCRVCMPGYKPTTDGSACECAPGYARNSTNKCEACAKGSYCMGGSSSATPCGEGLTSLTAGARSIEQCVSLPGYGYSKNRTTNADGSMSVTVTASQCPLNYYNPGSNSLPCRHCPGGLVTTAAGSSSVRACLAGPGFLFDKMVAKACPRGTYKGTYSQATACTKCPLGLTTPAVASVNVSQCTQAMPGYKVVTSGVSATACERNSYNPGFNTATTCTPCEGRLVTLNSGSKSEASCLAPPGVGYDPTAIPMTAACEPNTYKAGFNRKACSSCGEGFLSAAGADSKQRCYVPTGHGTIKISNNETRVVRCMDGVFGYPADTYGIFNLPCRPCQAGMTTWDVKPNVTASDVTNVNANDCFTLPGYGYDNKAQAAKRCEQGTFAAGWSKDPCMTCRDGYTTLSDGAVSEDECVIAAGWYWDTRASQVVPCDEGYYCLGGSLTADRTQCPTGTTTSREGGESSSDCNVCAGGYGSYTSAPSPSCSPCTADTYGPRGAIDACSACPNDAISAPQSDSAGDCYERWQKLHKDFDFLPVDNAASLLVPAAAGDASETACRESCDTTTGCVFYQYDDADKTCSQYVAPATASATTQVGFKVDTGVYAVIHGNALSVNIGKVISSPVRFAVKDCAHECDLVEGCVAVVVSQTANGYICDLRSGELSADIKSMYRVEGTNMDAWSV